MRNVLLVAIVLLSSVLVGVTVPTLAENRQRIVHVHESFFLSNNDDVMDALASYAEALCIQDKVTDDSPAAWLKASSQCADSYRDDEAMTTSFDGGWRAYVLQASTEITRICIGQAHELCQWFK